MKREKLSLLEKGIALGSGVWAGLAVRDPITMAYADFFAKHSEIRDNLDSVLATTHCTSIGVLAATAVGVLAGYATRKTIIYLTEETPSYDF